MIERRSAAPYFQRHWLLRFKTVMTGSVAQAYSERLENALDVGLLQRKIEKSGIDLRGKIVLDLAAGPGAWSVALSLEGTAQVVWVDLCPLMLGFSLNLCRRRRAKVNHVRGAMEAIPLAGESVDVVVCQDAIYHARKENVVCAEAARVLRAGGSFWLTIRTAGRLLTEQRPLWRKVLLWLSPPLALLVGRKLLPTPFSLTAATRRNLETAGFRVRWQRRLGDSTEEFLAVKL